jgi:hypothetical protein
MAKIGFEARLPGPYHNQVVLACEFRSGSHTIKA